MNINYYTLNFKKDCVKDSEIYMPFMRYLLHYHQYNLCPKSITFHSEIGELIDGEVLAHRLGLIMFKLKPSNKNNKRKTDNG